MAVFCFLEGTRGFLLVVPMCLVNVLPGKERNETIIKSDSAWKGSIEAGGGKTSRFRPQRVEMLADLYKLHHFKVKKRHPMGMSMLKIEI